MRPCPECGALLCVDDGRTHYDEWCDSCGYTLCPEDGWVWCPECRWWSLDGMDHGPECTETAGGER